MMKQAIYLMRLHKPIGIFLLLWPTLWAVWLGGQGHPRVSIVVIFVLGVVIMRSAGCIANDLADRNFDRHVARTRDRPLTSGKISVRAALVLLVILLLLALILVLLLNPLTLFLACFGVLFAVIYPFFKRFTHLPQAALGVAFSWGVPMAFAAQNNVITAADWQLFAAAAVWPVMYDTLYAMVDREDDLKIGVKSTAILLGRFDRLFVALLQIILVLLFINVGYVFKLHAAYFFALGAMILFFVYQQWLIRSREPAQCFNAFLNNNWVGLILFLGIVFS